MIGEARSARRPIGPPESVVIIGGGASGTLAAIHLLTARSLPRVVLIERSGVLGAGVAYASADPRHLLNVPAGRMSAFRSDPGHFARWLAASGRPEAGPETFAPRAWFADYLRYTLQQCALRAAGSVRLEVVHGLAVAARVSDAALEVALADGSRVAARHVVLATGPPSSPRPWPRTVLRLAGARRYVPDPWAPAALAPIAAGDSVVLAGTGLTMVDVAVSLAARGVRLEAVSRHGLLPLPHSGTPVSESARPFPAPARLVDLLREVRREADAADDWRSAVDGLRSQSRELWRSLPPSAQRQFLRHLRRHWEVHRHRIAPEVAAQLAQLLAEGGLRVRAGSITSVVETAQGVEVSLRPRGERRSETLPANYLVNCTGPAEMIDDDPQPLLASLLRERLARPDAHRLGLAVGDDGELAPPAGRHGSLFALGALRRGSLWETTAIAEIRAQAEELAASIAEASRSLAPAESLP